MCFVCGGRQEHKQVKNQQMGGPIAGWLNPLEPSCKQKSISAWSDFSNQDAPSKQVVVNTAVSIMGIQPQTLWWPQSLGEVSSNLSRAESEKPPRNETVVLWLMLLDKSVPCLCLSLTLPHPSLQLLGHVWLKPIKNYKAQWKCTPQWAWQRVLSCSGQDTWARDHESLGGNSQQISASARSLECSILFLSHINVAFRAGQAYNIFNWKVKQETWKQHPKKRFLSLYSYAIGVCVIQLQVLLDAIYSQWVLKASCNPYSLLFMQDYSNTTSASMLPNSFTCGSL